MWEELTFGPEIQHRKRMNAVWLASRKARERRAGGVTPRTPPTADFSINTNSQLIPVLLEDF
jgi:hypothetical protein